MSNNLNREIAVGEIVIVDTSYLLPPYHESVEARAFVCESGFGMKPYLSGRAIIGRWLDGKGDDRIEGYMIDVAATNEYQRAHASA